MARLIDADALPIAKEYCVDEAGFGCNFYVVHKTDIDKAPTIDAEPVKHGRWAWDGKHYYCSVCSGARFHDLVLGMDSAYCPYCGAKMGGEV